MFEAGDIKTFNPNKEIAKEIILEVLIRHRDALKQARTGELVGVSVESLTDNTRKLNQGRALNLIISAQREMINISRPIIYFRSLQSWKKQFKEDKEQEENPFDKFDCDYSKMINWKSFLRSCKDAIDCAERTPSLDDDFMRTKVDSNGEETNYLTENFEDMLEDLESSYEQIYLLMLTNKIVSAGIEEDEEMTYKEQEEAFIQRVVDA